jgi:predicted MFS family arabinose efflux permease
VTRRPRPARSPIRLLQLTTFVSTLDRFAMPPMLVVIARDLDVPLASIVQVAGIYFLVYGLSQPVWGAVSDRLGRVRTMRLTLLLAGFFTLASAGCGTPLALGIARGLAGGFFGAAYPSSLIYVGDTVPAAVRQRAVTQLMVGTAVGTALASVGAGILADAASWRLAFVITGVGSLALVWALRHLPEPELGFRHASLVEPLRAVAHSRMTLLILLFAFAEGAVLLGGLTLIPPAVEDAGASVSLAGAVAGVYGLSVFVCSALVGHLSGHWHPSRLILLGGAAAVLGCALLAVSRNPVVAVATAILFGLAWTSMHSSLQTWATEVLPKARATVVSLFAGSLFVGSALAAVVVAGWADDGRYSLIYAVTGALAVPLAVGAGWGRRRWHRPDETPST